MDDFDAHEDGQHKAPDSEHLETNKGNGQQSQRMSYNERAIRRDLMKVIDGRMTLMEQKLKQHAQDIEEKISRMEENIKKNSEDTREMITNLLESLQSHNGDVVVAQPSNNEQVEHNDNDLEKQRTISSQHKATERQKPWLKLNLKRFDHILTQESNYTLWRDKIRSEVLANDCLSVFEKDGKSRGTFDQEDMESMRFCVRSFIIGHLGSFHHSLVQYTHDPIEMMAKLDQAGQPISKFGEYELQDRLNSLKYETSETVLEFLQRFEDLIVQLRRYITLTDDQVKRSLILAIKPAMPTVYHQISNTPAPGPTLAEIKGMMFNEENMAKEEKRRAEQSSAVLCNATNSGEASTSNKGHQAKKKHFNKASIKKVASTTMTCGKCGVNGHQRDDCPNKGWKCYRCQRFTTSHYSKNCPYKGPSSNQKPKKEPGMKSVVKRLGGKSASHKHKGMTKIPLTKARKALRATTNNGHARLTILHDSDTESLPESQRCVWVNNEEFDYDAADLLYADATDNGSTSALALFDGNSRSPNAINFIADSGATDHIVNNDRYLVNVTKLSRPRRITCANADRSADLVITLMGDILIRSGDTSKVSCLRNVLYAPGLVENLFSIRKVVSSGLSVEFTARKLFIKDVLSGDIITTGSFCGRFWWLSFTLPSFNAEPQVVQSAIAEIGKLQMGGRIGGAEGGWHPRVGAIKEIHKGLPSFVDMANKVSPTQCKAITYTTSELPSGTMESGITKGGSHSMSLLGKRRATSQFHVTAEDQGTSAQQKRTTQESTSSDANEEDLKRLGSQRTNSLRDCIGYLWHLRLNHASLSYLRIAAKTIPELKGVKFGNEILDCEFCKMAKGKQLACSEVRHRSKEPFSRLWSDLMGPIKPIALRTTAKYIVTFTDDCTRYVMAYPISDKTRVHVALQSCLQEIRRLMQRETKVIEICTDGGKEYQTYEMKAVMSQEKISLKVCEPATPQHNGCSERLNLELQQKIRANLLAAKMPNYYWNHALNHVVHIHNRTPNRSIEFKSPYEKIMGTPPRLTHIKRFGCAAYYYDSHAREKSKFAQRSNLAILMECNDTGYTLLDANRAVITRSKHVDFIESKVYGDYHGPESILPLNEELSFRETEEQPNRNTMDVTETRADRTNAPSEGDTNIDAPQDEPASHSPGKSNQTEEGEQASIKHIGGTDQYDFFEATTSNTDENDDRDDDDDAHLVQLLQATASELEGEPITYKEAVNRPDSAQWVDAINDEFKALYKCNTWRIVPRHQVPDNLKIIKSRWVHRRKLEVNGTTRYRSRLVAKGFADNNDYDRTEVYSPVARLTDVRFILIIANKLDLELTQFDVRTAFLNGTLNKPVFMEVPEGLTEFLGKNKDFSQKYVCELKRSLYGLKVSPKCWFVRFQAAMEKLGFAPYEFQQCLFTWRDGDAFAILLLYVDDILLATNNKAKLESVTRELKEEFEITELGEPRKFLGMEIFRDRQRKLLFLHQRKFTEQIIKKYHSGNRKPVSSPMVPFDQREIPSGKDLSAEERKAIPYREVIGSLLYLQNGTRPDVAYATNIMSRKQSNFTLDDWNRVQRIITYLKNTTEMGLLYEGKSGTIECFVDASLGTNDANGHSTSGVIIRLFGDIIFWKTKKQNHVALSTAESEYVALSLACRELTNVQAMSQNLIRKTLIPTVYEDSVAAIELAKTDESSTLKHLVYLHYHYVRSEVRQKRINIQWISTNEQLADILTKALEPSKFVTFRNQIMYGSHSESKQ